MAPHLLSCATVMQPTADNSIITYAVDTRITYCFLFKNLGAFKSENSGANIPSKKLARHGPNESYLRVASTKLGDHHGVAIRGFKSTTSNRHSNPAVSFSLPRALIARQSIAYSHNRKPLSAFQPSFAERLDHLTALFTFRQLARAPFCAGGLRRFWWLLTFRPVCKELPM